MIEVRKIVCRRFKQIEYQNVINNLLCKNFMFGGKISRLFTLAKMKIQTCILVVLSTYILSIHNWNEILASDQLPLLAFLIQQPLF